MLGIEQKKGNENQMIGKMIVYAKINSIASEGESKLPLDDAVKNGLLVLEGDFTDMNKISEKTRKMRHDAIDEKIDRMIDAMKEDGVELPEEIDRENLKNHFEEISDMEVMPVPARVRTFETEEEILEENADVFYIGEFRSAHQAHFCIALLPVYYQARYREYLRQQEVDELNDALAQIESGEFLDNLDVENESEELFPKGLTLNTFMGDLGNLLHKRVIPFLLALESDEEYKVQVAHFYDFMKGYPDKSDVQLIDETLSILRKERNSTEARELLELGCQKIDAFYNEDVQKSNEFGQKILNYRKRNFNGLDF